MSSYSLKKFYICKWQKTFQEVVTSVKHSCNKYIKVLDNKILIVSAPMKKFQIPGFPLFSLCCETGKTAKSIFVEIKNKFVLAIPLTGRTHQLRVHSTYLDTPISGEQLYLSYNLEANNFLVEEENVHEKPYKFVKHCPFMDDMMYIIIKYNRNSEISDFVINHNLLKFFPKILPNKVYSLKMKIDDSDIEAAYLYQINLEDFSPETLLFPNLTVSPDKKILSWHRLDTTSELNLLAYAYKINEVFKNITNYPAWLDTSIIDEANNIISENDCYEIETEI